MNKQIQALYDTLKKIRATRINTVVVESTETGETFFRGEHENKSIIVLSKIRSDPPILTNQVLGIKNVDTFLKRLSLFDLEQSKFEYTLSADGVNARAIKVTQGQRKVSYTFTHPKFCEAPVAVRQDELITKIDVDKKTLEQLQSAVSATKPDLMTIEGNGESVYVKLFDGNADTYTDVIGDNSAGSWEHSWKADSVMLLLRESLKYSDETSISVSKSGIGHIFVDNVDFLIMPLINE